VVLLTVLGLHGSSCTERIRVFANQLPKLECICVHASHALNTAAKCNSDLVWRGSLAQTTPAFFLMTKLVFMAHPECREEADKFTLVAGAAAERVPEKDQLRQIR
jgi:hypothetical protein